MKSGKIRALGYMEVSAADSENPYEKEREGWGLREEHNPLHLQSDAQCPLVRPSLYRQSTLHFSVSQSGPIPSIFWPKSGHFTLHIVLHLLFYDLTRDVHVLVKFNFHVVNLKRDRRVFYAGFFDVFLECDC